MKNVNDELAGPARCPLRANCLDDSEDAQEALPLRPLSLRRALQSRLRRDARVLQGAVPDDRGSRAGHARRTEPNRSISSR